MITRKVCMATVLIADDEILELKYLSKLINDSSEYQLVGRAENGRQAIALAEKHHPDAIIMDINMPMNGLEAAQIIRKRCPSQTIIVNTAYANFEYARQAVTLHLDAYLLKPATKEEVLSTLNCCLRWKGHHVVASKVATIRDQLDFPDDVMRKMLDSLASQDTSLFIHDSAVYLSFLDEQNAWSKGCHLYLLNTAYRLGQQLRQLGLPKTVLELVDCENYIAKLSMGNGYELRLWMEELFRRISLAMETGKATKKNPLEIMCDYINKHYAEEIPLNKLAEITHFSPGHVSRVFNRQMGMTLRSYINTVRTENAVRLLQASDKSVTEIALDCGFHNLSHFYRTYRKHAGMTPKETRQEENKCES